MAPGPAIIKRSLRTIQSELEFLSETSVITQEQLSTILANLPNANTLQARGSEAHATSPAPSVSVSSPPPTHAFSNLNVSENPPKNGYYGGDGPSPAPAQYSAPPAYPQPPQPPPNTIKYATALYAYRPSDNFDLELSPGERIAIVEEMNADWWKGRSERTGREGIFPRSYVKEEEKFNGGPPNIQRPVSSYGNMPTEVAYNQQQQQQQYPPGQVPPNKAADMGKKFGKKLGNAAIFGAGATIGSDIVNSIF